MTFTSPQPRPMSTGAGNKMNPYANHGNPNYWQESCLRSRRSMTIIYSPPLTSTPIRSNMNNAYAKGGSVMYHHQQQTSYYNYPTLNPMSSGLTQVLATYAPGTTVLCLDPKDKQTRRIAPRVRLIFLAALIFLAVLGGTTYLWTKGTPTPRSQTVPPKILADLPKNSSSMPPIHATQLPRPPTVPVSRPERIQPPARGHQAIYSFDDEDLDNEAYVETVS